MQVGVVLVEATGDAADSDRQQQLRIAYRAGEIVAPALPETEALYGAVSEFISSIVEGRAPATGCSPRSRRPASASRAAAS